MSLLEMVQQKVKVHRCRRCNRPLTDPESIRLGIGPICLEKMPRKNSLWDLVWGREMDAELAGEFIGE